MKETKSTISVETAVKTLNCSRENVNRNNVSSDNILNSIFENGWNPDSPIMVAGSDVPRHDENDIIRGNNRFTAIVECLELVKKLPPKERKAVIAGMFPNGIEIVKVSNVSNPELANLYNDIGNRKTITRIMVIKVLQKLLRAGMSLNKACFEIKGNLDQIQPLTGDKKDKAEKALKDWKAGNISQSEYSKIIFDIRHGFMQGLQAQCFNKVALSIAEKLYDGQGSNELYTYATIGDCKKLRKAFLKDLKVQDETGTCKYSFEDRENGKTPEFEKAYNELLQELKVRSSEEKPAPKRMLTRAQLESVKDSAQSELMARVISVILCTDKTCEGSEVEKLMTFDSELKALEPSVTAEVEQADIEPVKVSAEKPKVKAKGLTAEQRKALKA